VPNVVEAFGKQADAFPKEVALLSTAAASDIDMVVTDASLPDKDNLVRKVGIYIDNWEGAKKQSAVFSRGHEVPWSFSVPMWGCPWTPFYAMAEPFTILIQLRELSAKVGLDARAQELLRSLALNRHSNLCYTRDRLLYYVQQQRASARANFEKQDFGFELGYYLNHYYLLFWAGLDQLCWIVNSVFALGYKKAEWQKVGPLNPAFIARMREVAPQVAAVFLDPDFLHWAKMLRSARHFVAHEGLAMPSMLVLTKGEEPSEEELDHEVERSNEWRELEKSIPRNLLEEFRPTFRFKAKLRRYKQCPERVLKLQIDGETCLIYPLLNIEWDFASYYTCAEKVARLAIDQLKKKAAAQTAEA